jgi:ribose transport system substrate-binding protein
MLELTKRAFLVSTALGMAAIAVPAIAQDKIIIGFSQASSNSAHRNTMTKRNVDYAAANFADA